MLLQEVKEDIKNQDFDGARQKLKEILKSDTSEKLEAFKLILFISKDLNTKEYKQFESDFILYLDQQNLNEELYKVLKSKHENKNSVLTFEHSKIFLNLLWKVGRVQEFSSVAKEVNHHLIENKRFNQYFEFYDFVLDKTKKLSFLSLSLIWAYLETNQITKAVKETKKSIKDTLCAYKRNDIKSLKLLNSLKDMIERCDSNDYRLLQVIKLILIETLCLTSKQLGKRDLIEFLLLSEDLEELLLIQEVVKSDEFKEIFNDYLIQKYSLKKMNIPKRCVNALEAFNSRNIMVQTIAQNKEDDEHELLADIEIKPSKRAYYTEDIVEQVYKISEIEQDILKQLEFQTVPYSQREQMCMSFIDLELYTCALRINSLLNDSLNKSYLEAEILLRMGKNSEVIIIVNDAIKKYDIAGEDRVPFLYQKFNAFKKLKDIESAVRAAQEISRLNPHFKQVSEFLVGPDR